MFLYVPRVYPRRIIHFRPRRDYKCHLGVEVEGVEVECHRMQAYPAGMMVNPFVAELAEGIRREMDRGLSEVDSKCVDVASVVSFAECEAVGA